MTSPDEPVIPLSRVTKFVRQVTHDVRNGLNAMDLQATFAAEIATDPEVAGEVKKVRQMISQVAKNMQHLSTQFSAPNLNAIDLPARDFAAAFRERAESELEDHAAQLVWNVQLGSEEMDVDFEMLTAALLEILHNSFQFRDGEAPVRFDAGAKNGSIIFEIREPKTVPPVSPESWGREPLVTTRRGALGLGLFRARGIIGAHRGEMQPRVENGELIITITLPQRLDPRAG